MVLPNALRKLSSRAELNTRRSVVLHTKHPENHLELAGSHSGTKSNCLTPGKCSFSVFDSSCFRRLLPERVVLVGFAWSSCGTLSSSDDDRLPSSSRTHSFPVGYLLSYSSNVARSKGLGMPCPFGRLPGAKVMCLVEDAKVGTGGFAG